MSGPIYSALAPVRRRQRCLAALQGLGWGAAASALAGGAWALGRFSLGWSLPLEGLVALLATGPVLGLVAGWCWHHSWTAAALAVDTEAGLKDRTVSALEFLNKPAGPLTELQLA